MTENTRPEDQRSVEQFKHDPGPYLARVVSHVDAKYMGTLQVELLNDVGRDILGQSGSTIPVKYLSPFYGVTSTRYLQDSDDYGGTQKSYGMWMVPPDVGSIVMVIFVNGNAAKGYWIGCVPDEYMNFMVPGLAATEANKENPSERKVVAEYNKKKNDLSQPDTTQIPKPVHPFQKVLKEQGLALDDTRGITTSSARRETPSAVFGISTPGPVDRQPNAPTGTVGKYESQIASAFVSRMGGTTFVMDDGDDTFLRKTKASEGPPEYASVENRETGGLPDIPHNELVRIRTRTGHQILLHNSEDLIYIGNARGTAWIELTSNGKIDIYSADSVSIHTEKDFNFKADNDVNIEAGNNINIKAGANFNIESVADMNVIVGANNKIHVAGDQSIKVDGTYTLDANERKEKVGANYSLKVGSSTTIDSGSNLNLKSAGTNNIQSSGVSNIKAGGNILMTGAHIHLNGPAAGDAASASAVSAVTPPDPIPAGEDGIVQRAPQHEPWAGHENLHGAGLKYSTTTDTFKKISK